MREIDVASNCVAPGVRPKSEIITYVTLPRYAKRITREG